MKTIWKYPLQITDVQEIMMPEQAKILHVEMQGISPCLWVLVDSESKQVPRYIRVVGTGNPFPDADQAMYIGSFQMMGDILVWHVFEGVFDD